MLREQRITQDEEPAGSSFCVVLAHPNSPLRHGWGGCVSRQPPSRHRPPLFRAARVPSTAPP